MRLKTYVNKLGQIYIPKKIRKQIGLKPDEKAGIEYIANRKTILILPKDMTPTQALRSLEIIKIDLEDEIREKKERKEGVNP